MVDRFVVTSRLARIRQYLGLLRRIRDIADEQQFVSVPLVYGNAERYLQLAIQAVLDISHHIVADRQLPLPPDSKSLFEVLVREKVVSRPLADGSDCRQMPGSPGRRGNAVRAPVIRYLYASAP